MNYKNIKSECISRIQKANELYIVDAEYNGVDSDGEYATTSFRSEVVQFKYLHLARINGEFVTVEAYRKNFKSKSKWQYGAINAAGYIRGKEIFDINQYKKIFCSGIPIIGWGISTDKKIYKRDAKSDLLRSFIDNMIDLQSIMKCHKTMSEKIVNLASFHMDTAWLAVYNRRHYPKNYNPNDHHSIGELMLIKDMVEWVDRQPIEQFTELPIYCTHPRYKGRTFEWMGYNSDAQKTIYGIVYQGYGDFNHDPWETAAAKAAY